MVPKLAVKGLMVEEGYCAVEDEVVLLDVPPASYWVEGPRITRAKGKNIERQHRLVANIGFCDLLSGFIITTIMAFSDNGPGSK